MKWVPKDGAEEFKERCIEWRGKGYSWRKICAKEGIGKSTLYRWLKDDPEFQKIVERKGKSEAIDNLRETALELALVKKNPTMIIYLLKALARWYDTRGELEAPDEKDAPEKLPAMTKAEAKKLLEARKAKK